MTMMWTAQMSAQNNDGNVKLVNDGRLPVVYPMADIDSITFVRVEDTDIPSLDQVTPEDLARLIVRIYPEESPAMICELGSDNFVDNNVLLSGENFKGYSGLYDQMFTWSEVSSTASYTISSDSPLKVWNEYLYGISKCDYILKAAAAIESAQPSQAALVKPYQAEALIVRSYLRSVLAGVFDVDFSASIESDLQTGLQLLDYLQNTDATRMTRRAACAYAARHYLMKYDWQKVEQYATAALGDNPAAMLRNWSELSNASDINEKLERYYASDAPCNYYIQRTYSMRDRMLFSCRYATNGDPLRVALRGSGPVWDNTLPCYNANIYRFGDQAYGLWLFRAYEFFEYTDEEQGIGYVTNTYTPFTAEETLLMRAEARFYRGNTEGCLADLNVWLQSKQVSTELTLDNIQSFYTNASNAIYQNNINMNNAGWSEADKNRASQNKPLLDCLLHFRRIETLYDGLRWTDLQRYGINIQHQARQPYADAKTYESKYHYPMPAVLDATSGFGISLHMKDKSVVTASANQILFGGDNEADEKAKASFTPSDNGWILQSFDYSGESTQQFFSNDECRIVGEGLMTLGEYGQYQGETTASVYRILFEKAGEEYLLQELNEDPNYPVVIRLVACPMPWAEYQEKCELTRQALWWFSIWRSGNLYMTHKYMQIMLSTSPEFTENVQYCPFVYTPTGIRLANAEALSCDPEFILDTTNNTLTSQDLTMTFQPDYDFYLENLLNTASKQYEITYDETNTELASVVAELNSSLLEINANYSFKNLFLGKTTGTKATNGIGFVLYTNAEKTKSSNCGIASSFSCQNGHLQITTPGLAEGEWQMSRNMQTLTNKSESLKNAVSSLLNLMEGDYTYTIGDGFYDMKVTKVGNPNFSFTVSFQ
jgi:hypothetical protein